jgi:hypothetical protein
MPMTDETELVTEADCVLCRDLDPVQRVAMRTDLLEIPLPAIDNICEGCCSAADTAAALRHLCGCGVLAKRFHEQE